MNRVRCILASFYVRQKVSRSFAAPWHQILAILEARCTHTHTQDGGAVSHRTSWRWRRCWRDRRRAGCELAPWTDSRCPARGRTPSSTSPGRCRPPPAASATALGRHAACTCRPGNTLTTGKRRGRRLPYSTAAPYSGVLISLWPWVNRWLYQWSLYRMATAMPDPWLPSQSQSANAHWPVPDYTAWWQRHNGVNNLPGVVTQPRPNQEPANSWS